MAAKAPTGNRQSYCKFPKKSHPRFESLLRVYTAESVCYVGSNTGSFNRQDAGEQRGTERWEKASSSSSSAGWESSRCRQSLLPSLKGRKEQVSSSSTLSNAINVETSFNLTTRHGSPRFGNVGQQRGTCSSDRPSTRAEALSNMHRARSGFVPMSKGAVDVHK